MNWQIYPSEAIQVEENQIDDWLSRVPPWRKLHTAPSTVNRTPDLSEASERRGRTYITSGADEVLRVNAALMLRRPLLVTGKPGIGKSSLAYSIAWRLGLGDPLRWEINSQSTLQDGLYHYDAVGHLQASQSRAANSELSDFVSLGPLGTALLPTPKPRVLLIDELDKSSFDLPNDLLHVFEEGRFLIPELVRAGGETSVYASDSTSKNDRVTVSEGQVRTLHHPVVIVTSNGEREFPEAFRRRCVELQLQTPSNEHLAKVIQSQLGDSVPDKLCQEAMAKFKGQTTDVLLQVLFLAHCGADLEATSLLKR